MIALVDADILLYRCGFASEKRRRVPNEQTGEVDHYRDVAPFSHAIQNVRTVLDAISSKYDTLRLFLSGPNNFRANVATIKPYKGNRSPFAKPVHYAELKEYLIEKHGAVLVDGMEADDAIGIAATSEDNTCVVSTDKDLDMIPGHHYNWVKNDEYTIDEGTGYQKFYSQLLTGDRVDNIPGIHGVGPVAAKNIIGRETREDRLWRLVRTAWHEHYPGGYESRRVDDVLLEVGTLLWISRKGRERWSPPT